MGGIYTTWLASNIINSDFQLLLNRINVDTNILIYGRLNEIPDVLFDILNCIFCMFCIFIQISTKIDLKRLIDNKSSFVNGMTLLKNAKLGDHNQRWHMASMIVPVVYEYETHT